ncbi:MAG: hypothetical protein JW719_10215 [Pirellulales bacterium]|nr:hypothetical protein [Pirellulales bacterium]
MRRAKVKRAVAAGLAMVGMILVAATVQAARAPSGEALRGLADWAPPAVEAVRTSALAWLDEQNVDDAARQRAERIWAQTSEGSTAADRLTALAMTLALGDSRAERLVRLCAAPREGIELPDTAWLAEPDVPPLVSANLRLLAGRWMVQESLFDEAKGVLGNLQPDEVVDPASLLFFQAVVHHRLLDKEAGLAAIDRLLAGRRNAPRRYVALAELMRGDLEGVSEDTLDHIARRMEDIERRLELGHAGPKVRGIEDGVIRSLDKLIKDLEDQQQQSPSESNNLQSSRPADESKLMGGLGPGRVTRKNLGGKSGWGNLPPKQREEALQEIGRQFPSHYREVIEQYFRKMAGEEPAGN